MKASQAGKGLLEFGFALDSKLDLDPDFCHLATCAVCKKQKQNRYGMHTHYPSGQIEITCCQQCEKQYENNNYAFRSS